MIIFSQRTPWISVGKWTNEALSRRDATALPLRATTKSAEEPDDDADQQDETQTTAAINRASDIKTAATEQE
jgi:hypothetical protein